MNSKEGFKGFITFLIVAGIVSTVAVALSYLSANGTNTSATSSNNTPLGVNVYDIQNDSVNISWNTIDATSSSVSYSEDLSQCLKDNSCQVVNDNTKTKNHSIQISGLKEDTSYQFKISIYDALYPIGDNNFLSFQTTSSQNAPLAPFESVTPSQEENINADYSGFEQNSVINDGPKLEDKVLGSQSAFPIEPLKDINTLVVEEFKTAVLYNDLRYDFNKDKNVTSADYPLFIEFIMNQED